MKRIPKFLLALLLVASSFAVASAATIKTTGQFDFALQWTDNTNFYATDEDRNSEDDVDARQRVRVQSVIATSENVAGTLFFEIGEIAWGNDAQGGGTWY
ncbi:hypothetical protein [Oleidesulfovibrio sp.]|uniref:hypothetical protein n=1 Tax=Oleidesulfovibrio sp. TaxID=2909707 RepID=UPI003A89107C